MSESVHRGVSFALYAVDIATGNLKWKYAQYPGDSIKWSYTTLGPVFASPTVVIGVVYVCTGGIDNGELNAIDAASGTLKWKFTADTGIGDIFASPCIVDQLGNIYESTISGNKN
jgi:outer membrane protein assembly factor BamB